MLPFAELMTACQNDSASTESAKRLVLTWINYSSAETLPHDGDEYNEMQVFGLGLAYMLSKYDALQIRSRRWPDMPAALATPGHDVHEFSCQQCLDFLRVVQNAINAAVAGAGRAEVFSIEMNSDSKVNILSTGAFRTASLPVAFLAMGFASNLAPYATSFTGSVPPAYFATFVEQILNLDVPIIVPNQIGRWRWPRADAGTRG